MEQTNPHALKRMAISIYGRVQAVGYRYFIKEAAQRYHISGWVKNMETGEISIEAQGEDELLKRFVQDVEQGPRISHVDEMKIAEIPVKEQERSFSIRYFLRASKQRHSLLLKTSEN